ncbi:hypothetical protein BUALT_Bualt05G0147800 [Buddleja alternifolia]|uniref:Uncharacterized protein n=1 Tax=Buddleja alternifolia TaxID=168488 RepID=A0AAV6XJE3_9LAMI|nr:hypothetical protein BUALT_Bualt05G0147800 [Buddleja alternifolia]
MKHISCKKMAGNALHLFVTILALSSLVSLIHLPPSKAMRLLHETQAISSPEDILQAENLKETMEMEEGEFFNRRMDFEINRDYPGSGANNRHTPNPPVRD